MMKSHYNLEKKPILYYQVQDSNMMVPAWDFCAVAQIGAAEEGIITLPFLNSNTIAYDPYNIIVGSVEETSKYLKRNQIEIPKPLDRSWCSLYENRNICEGYLEDIEKFPIFIKPAEDIKAFTGSVVYDRNDAKNLTKGYQGKLLISDVIDGIVSEWRYYIDRNRGAIAMKPYAGLGYYPPKITKAGFAIHEAVRNIKAQSFTLDFAVTSDVKTYLIEINDGWAIGSYGMEPHAYYHFVKKRFLQLTGVLTS